MSAKVTIVKNYRNTETLRSQELQEVIRSVQSCEYQEAVQQLRYLYTAFTFTRQADGSVSGATNYTNKIPRVCFASEMENRQKQRVRKGYTGLVLLEVNN
ncbi:MAG: hypothetical protein IJ868_01240, partial [Prevotella sp.]|nr:hypothetical protein [Prevotella sp.]